MGDHGVMVGVHEVLNVRDILGCRGDGRIGSIRCRHAATDHQKDGPDKSAFFHKCLVRFIMF
jgi:hypothetical protein